MEDEGKESFEELVRLIMRIRIDMLCARIEKTRAGHKTIARPLLRSEFFRQLSDVLEVKFPRDKYQLKTYGDIVRYVLEVRAQVKAKGEKHVS